MALNRAKTKANAEKLLRQGKVADAIREFQKLVEDNPNDESTLNQLGNLHLRAGNPEAAVPMFLKVAEIYNKKGFALKAVASLRIVTRVETDNLQAHELLASLNEQQGFIKEARLSYEKIAQIAAASGNIQSATKYLQKILEMEPENLKARIQIGDMLIKGGNTQEGVKFYLKAGEMLMAQGMIKEAATIYDRALQMDPQNLGILEGVVKSYLAQKEGQKALELLDSLQQRQPDTGALSLLKIDALIELKQYDAAASVCREALSRQPGDHQALAKLVRVHILQGGYDDATHALDESAAPLTGRALAQMEPLYQEILRFSADHIPTLSSLYKLYKRSGQEQRLPNALTLLSESAISVGQFEQARSALRELISLEPQNEQHKDKLRFVEQKMGIPPPEPPRPEPAQVPPEAVDVETEVDLESEVEIEAEIEVETEIEVEPEPERAETVPEESLSAEAGPPEASDDEAEDIEVDVSIEGTGEHEIEVELEDLNLPPADLTSSHIQRPPTAAAKKAPPRVTKAQLPHLEAKDAEAIREQLTEAEVFLKYGLTDKAVAELQGVLKKVPDHIQAHQKLISIFKGQKKTDKAVRQILRLALIFRDQGDEETCESLVDEVRGLDPNHKALQAFLKPGGAEAGTETAAESVSREETLFPELDLGLKLPITSPGRRKTPVRARPVEEPATPMPPDPEEEEIVVDLGEDSREEAAKPEPAEEFSLSIEPAEVETHKEYAEKLEEAEFYVSQELFGEAERALSELEEEHSADPRVMQLRERLRDLTEPSASESDAEVVDLEPEEEQAAEPSEDPGAFSAEGGSTADEAPEEEAAQGEPIEDREAPIPDEPPEEEESVSLAAEEFSATEAEEEIPPAAEEAAEESVEEEPAEEEITAPVFPAEKPSATAGNKKVRVSLKDLVEEEEEEESSLLSGEGEEKSDEYYDLAAELGAALDGLQDDADTLFEEETKSPEEMSFEEIFEEFKKGVGQKVGEEDYATHYNLGIAYKEMELMDEAIGEFQYAARSPEFFMECCSMLGLCFRQKGLQELAEKWYRKGIEAPGFAEEIYVGLKYDLAESLEESGKMDEARQLYKEIYALNATYRNIRDKIKL